MSAGPNRRRLLGAGLAIVATGSLPAESAPAADQIHAAIKAVRLATAELTAALADLDEDDPAQMARANTATDRDGLARAALSRTLPTTPAGFRALVRFHAADVAWLEPDTVGAIAVRDIAAAMEALLGSERPSSRKPW